MHGAILKLSFFLLMHVCDGYEVKTSVFLQHDKKL